MKKFRFRLETLLKIRRMKEEEAQIFVAQATVRVQEEQALLQELENDKVGLIHHFRDSQRQVLTVETLKNYQLYFDKLTRDIHTQTLNVENAHLYRNECLDRLSSATQERKVVEKLREKHLAEYQAETLKEEQQVLDELGLKTHQRK